VPNGEKIVTAGDGRDIEVVTFGDPQGPTVVFHHGTPGCASTARAFETFALDAGLFVLCASRPGYGNSTALPGRNVAAVVEDVTAVLDAWGRNEYIAVGWSGGGPHALACAALDAPRCVAAWSLAGVAPYGAGFDWTEGMGPENVEEFELSVAGGPDYQAFLDEVVQLHSHATAENYINLFGALISHADLVALAPESVRAAMAASDRHAFAHGVAGYRDDDRVFVSPWGFDVTSIDVPIAIWFGDDDLMVPPTHGRWLAANIPTATEVFHPGHGHFDMVLTDGAQLAADLSAMASIGR